ncbi:hypothetical protein ABZV52_29995 [Streptomyces sp. NPDC004735]
MPTIVVVTVPAVITAAATIIAALINRRGQTAHREGDASTTDR